MKNLGILLLIVFISVLSGCKKAETLDQYEGYLIIDRYRPGINGVYKMTLKSGDTIETINTYRYYYHKYELGDIVKEGR